MWVYWTLFWWPALISILYRKAALTDLLSNISMFLLALYLTLIIGLRYEVGVDWDNYLNHLDQANTLFLHELLARGDFAYWMVCWFAAQAGFGVWFVNLVCALVFVCGFYIFCRRLPNPWLALTIGMPYIAIVMAMNYTRQSAAFGFMLVALMYLLDGHTRRFVFFIIAASLFHKTAAILLPLGVLAVERNRLKTIIWLIVASILAFAIFLAESQEAFFDEYVFLRYTSDGAGIRIIMNSVAAAVYLIFRSRVKMSVMERRFWSGIAWISLMFIPILLLSPSSTAVDRVALYFMPIQLLAFTHLPNVIWLGKASRIITLSIASGYWAVMFVWFNYSNFHYAWLPYKFYPFEY